MAAPRRTSAAAQGLNQSENSTPSAVLSEVYAHGPGKDVQPSKSMPRRRQGPGRRRGIALAALARSGPFGQAVARTLRLALAPRRWEPWNPYNDHRVYPSPRAAYLVDVAVRAGTDRWPVDPVRGRLIGAPGEPVVAALAHPGAVHLELSVHPDRMPAGYGPLATALAWLEAGHVAAALAETAAAVGLRAECGASPAAQPGAPAPVAARIVLTPGDGATWPWERVAARRSSGVGPRGLTPDPRPLLHADLHALVRAAHEPPPGSPAGWAARPLRIRHALAVHNVRDLADGWYTIADADPLPRALGPAVDGVQAAFSYPPSSIDVSGVNVGWVMTADIAGAVRTDGAVAYHQALLAAGAVAQHVGTAAAVAGLFCRPARSVHETPLEAAAGAPASHDFVYLLLIGRSRVHGFTYDLAEPEVLQ